MPAYGVVEAFDIVEHIGPCLIPCPVDLAGGPFGLQKLSIAAVSQTLPERLIEQVTP